MAASDLIAYRPLTRRVRPFALAVSGSYQLFLGPDHLLYVADLGFSETYKRFFFQDIQAMVVTQSTRRRNINLVLAALGVVTGLFILAIAAAVNNSELGLYLLAGAAVVFGTAFAINSALGPTCICSVKTAVQNEPILPLIRLHKTLKAADEIGALITAAQGELTADAVQAAVVPTGSMPVRTPSPPVIRPPPRHEPGYWHMALFSLLLLDAGVVAIDTMVTNILPTVISTVLTVAHVAVLVGAIIKQRDSDIGRPVRLVIWCVLGYILVGFGLGYTQLMVATIQNQGQQASQWEWIEIMAATSPWDSPLLTWIYLFSIIVGVILGGLGLVFIWQHRRDGAESPVVSGATTTPD